MIGNCKNIIGYFIIHDNHNQDCGYDYGGHIHNHGYTHGHHDTHDCDLVCD